MKTGRKIAVVMVCTGLMAVAVWLVVLWSTTSPRGISTDVTSTARRSASVAVSAPSSPRAQVRVANPALDEAGRLEARLGEIQNSRADLLKKLVQAGQEARAADSKDPAAKELQEARLAVETALDKHPVIAGKKKEIQELEKELGATSMKQVKILESLHAAQKERKDAAKKGDDKIVARMDKEVAAFMKKAGKKDRSELTPEEARKLSDIQNRYAEEAEAFRKKVEQAPRNEAERTLADNYTALRKNLVEVEERERKILEEMKSERQRLRREDPAIAALNQALVEKNARLNSVVSARPEIQEYSQQLQSLDKERQEIWIRLGKLRNQNSEAQSKTAASAVEKKG